MGSTPKTDVELAEQAEAKVEADMAETDVKEGRILSGEETVLLMNLKDHFNLSEEQVSEFLEQQGLVLS